MTKIIIKFKFYKFFYTFCIIFVIDFNIFITRIKIYMIGSKIDEGKRTIRL